MTYVTAEAKYNERAAVLSKTLIFLFIPIYAVVFFVLFSSAGAISWTT
jgi:hypothetical protein